MSVTVLSKVTGKIFHEKTNICRYTNPIQFNNKICSQVNMLKNMNSFLLIKSHRFHKHWPLQKIIRRQFFYRCCLKFHNTAKSIFDHQRHLFKTSLILKFIFLSNFYTFSFHFTSSIYADARCLDEARSSDPKPSGKLSR